MANITLLGHDFDYTVTRRRTSSISVRIHEPSEFTISAPYLVPNFVITKFIYDHSKWIVANCQKNSTKFPLSTLKMLQIVGDNYEISIKESARDSVVIFKDEHKIYTNSTSLSETHLKKLFDTKFRSLALSLITAELKILQQKYNFIFNKVTVKNTTSRFGSCSSTNNLNFNWQIIFFPPDIFRHILLHELTHTIHHDHSTRFWKQFAIYDPSWRLNRHYLKTHGQKHFII